jgi:hypothetical protein
VPAGFACEVIRRKDQDVDVGRILDGVHLADETPARLEVFPVDQHLRPTRLENRNQTAQNPGGLFVAIADEDLRRHDENSWVAQNGAYPKPGGHKPYSHRIETPTQTL